MNLKVRTIFEKFILALKMKDLNLKLIKSLSFLGIPDEL